MCTISHHKTGNGYIPTSSLKEILHELDDQLTNEDLEGIINEIDEDGSGTVDFNGKLTLKRCHLEKCLFLYLKPPDMAAPF